MSKKKINLAIIFPSINDWLGGLNYFINLITALKLIQKKNFNFKIFSQLKIKNFKNLEKKSCLYKQLKKIFFKLYFQKSFRKNF